MVPTVGAGHAGETLTYNLSVSNNGPSTASNVVIRDVLPAGVSIVSVSSSGGTCNAGVPGNAALPTTCTFDSMVDGASESMTIVVTVLPDTLGLLHNDASVSSDTADPDNSNDLATETTTVNTEADLVATKTDSPDPVLAGNQLTYTMTVTNNGPSVSRAVKLTDTLPSEVSFLSATADNGAPCVEVQPGVVECSLGDLVVGQTVTVYIDVKVDPSVPDGSLIINSAEVVSQTHDPLLANNFPAINTTVNAEADLWLEKTGFVTSGSTKNAGNSSGTVVYQLIVHNDGGCAADDVLQCGDGGPSDAQDVVVVDSLPEDAKKFVVEVVSEACSYDGASHQVTCTTGTLPAGATVVHEIQGKVKGNAGVITNVATVSTTTTDPNGDNNSHDKELTIGGGKGNQGGKP